jgi:predicted RND superfamily exporter protein
VLLKEVKEGIHAISESSRATQEHTETMASKARLETMEVELKALLVDFQLKAAAEIAARTGNPIGTCIMTTLLTLVLGTLGIGFCIPVSNQKLGGMVFIGFIVSGIVALGVWLLTMKLTAKVRKNHDERHSLALKNFMEAKQKYESLAARIRELKQKLICG